MFFIYEQAVPYSKIKIEIILLVLKDIKRRVTVYGAHKMGNGGIVKKVGGGVKHTKQEEWNDSNFEIDKGKE